MTPRVGDRISIADYAKRFAKFPLVLFPLKGVSFTAKALYVRIGLYAGTDGKAWPTRATLAKDLGITKSAINKALKQLVTAKLLDIEPGIGRRPTRYYPLLHEIFIENSQNAPLPHVANNGLGKNSHSPSGLRNNSHSHHSESEKIVPLRPTKDSNQKRTSSKEQKEEKKTRVRSLTDEQQAWIERKLAVDVFHHNLSGIERQARRKELETMVMRDDLGPSMETIHEEEEAIERRIKALDPRFHATCLEHLKKGTLAQDHLRMFDTQTKRQANA